MSDEEHISEEDIAHLAGLARLSLSDDEISDFREKLDELLGHCERLGDVPEVEDDQTLSNVFAPENVDTTLSREAATSNAETTDDGEFRGPSVGDGG